MVQVEKCSDKQTIYVTTDGIFKKQGCWETMQMWYWEFLILRYV